MKRMSFILITTLLAGAALGAEEPWVEHMKTVHAKFTGQAGTVMEVGDSITITMAFFTPLQGEIKNLPDDLKPAHKWLLDYVQNRCWTAWKGPEWGNNGQMTSNWGATNIDGWIKKMNPEVALIMFGTNDLGAGPKPPEYDQKMKKIVTSCLENGTIPVLYTIPPVGRQAGDAKQTAYVETFVDAVRKLAAEQKVPLIDYYKEMITRQPKEFAAKLLGDGVHPSYPKEYQNDFSEEGLKNSGYTLRNYVTLKALWEINNGVLTKVKSARTKAMEAGWAGPKHNDLPAVVFAKTDAPPTIDGKLDDAAWKKAEALPFRYLDGDTTKVKYATTARLLSDDKALYIAFECAEPDMANLKSKEYPRDGNIWEGDSVEVFVLPAAEGREYYHLAVNPDGSFMDSFAGKADQWQPQLKLAAVKGKDGWSIEIAIPYSQIKLPDKTAQAGPWRVNLTRFRPGRTATEFTEDTALSPTNDTSSHKPWMFAFGWVEALGGKLPAK